MSGSLWIGTANRGFAQQAQEEVRRLFDGGPVTCEWLIPTEVFSFAVPADRGAVLQRLKEQEPVFLRHVHPVETETPWDGTPEGAISAVEALISGAAGESLSGRSTAVQIRKIEGGAAAGISLPALKEDVEELLKAHRGADPVAREAELILSVFLAEGRLFAGVSKPQDNLSDWTGGAVRFRREEGQISRAKFKLLEAELAFGLDFSQYRTALDIGAAPGGWTSLLLERGLQVTAVDPAKMDASLQRHPALTYLSKKADEVQFAENQFDLLVCDMSWSHRQMARLVKGLLPALVPGGTAIITLKLMNKKAFQTIREAVSDLSPALELQQAKQLFHNREELTLFLIRQS